MRTIPLREPRSLESASNHYVSTSTSLAERDTPSNKMKLYTAAYIALAAPPAAAVYIPIPSKPLCALPCPSAAICIADPNPRCVVPNG